jgi:integrase
MPPVQRGHARKLPSGRWQLRYYDDQGEHHSGGVFQSKSQALAYYRDSLEPMLTGTPSPRLEMTLSELVDVYLARHRQIRSDRTIQTLRERLARPLAAYGAVTLGELEGMAGDMADFRATLPPRYAHSVMRSLRQVFAAGIRYGYMTRNPAELAGENPLPSPRQIRVYTIAELTALDAELGAAYGPLVPLGAATGLRPQELVNVERRDIDRTGRLLTARGTKTAGSHRQVPLTGRALAALERIPAQLQTPLLFTAPDGGPIRLDNFRKRVWAPGVAASGIATPARLYDLRSTFASNALAAGVTVFELAKVMGTSVRMIERHYGALLGGAHAGIAGRLDAIEAELGKAIDETEEAQP